MSDDPLLYGARLDGRGGAERLDWSAASTSTGDDAPRWLHLDRRPEATRRWLESDAGIDATVLEALLGSNSRPRVEPDGNGLFVSLRGVNLNPGADPEDMISIRMFIQPDRLITLRREQLLSTQDVIERLDAGRGPRTIGSLVADIVAGLTRRMEPVLEALVDKLDELEDRVLDDSKAIEPHELAETRREIIALHRHLVPQVVALQHLQRVPTPVLDSGHRRSIGETVNRVTRYVEELDAARSRGAVIQDELSAQLVDATNRRMYAVTVIAGIFLPLSFVTGLLGINVAGIPGSNWSWAFTAVTVGLILLGVGGVWLVRRARWL